MNEGLMEISPIGVVKSDIDKPLMSGIDYDAAPEIWKKKVRDNQKLVNNTVAQLVINHEYVELLLGIEEFSHILVLFWPHLIPAERRKIKTVHPMGRQDMPLRGVFATCSPARPNPILVTAVELIGRQGNVLEVKGLEAIDGTPVIDIKPYSRNYHHVNNPVVPEWMRRLHEDIGVDQ